jgi:short-subunit dehydrogenase
VKAVLFGATQGMGRAVARVLAARGDTLCLLGRSPDSLERSAVDLESRGASGRVVTLVCDLMEPERFGPALDEATSLLDGLDAVIMSAGVFGTQQELEEDEALRRSVLLGNFVYTIEFCEAARNRLLARGGGTLCVFSSVAGERGRKPVGLYGSTKAGLTRYLESLDHRHHADGLRVVTVKPGFVHTAMTGELDPPPFAGHPEAVAAQVVRAMDAGHPVVYAPPVWRFVMAVVRQLPRFVMRRVGF